MEVGVDTQSEIDSEMLKGRNTVAECHENPYGVWMMRKSDSAATAAKNKATKGAIAFKTRYIFIKRLGKCNY
jgi:hypothetical protein